MKRIIPMLLAIVFATFITQSHAMPPKKAVTKDVVKVEKAISPQVVFDMSPQATIAVAENNLVSKKGKLQTLTTNFYDKALTAEDASPGVNLNVAINTTTCTKKTTDASLEHTPEVVQLK